MTGTTRLGVSAAVVDGELVSGDVRLDGDVVAAVGLPPAPGGGIAVPGLVDVQVNGYAGIDLLTAPADDWQVGAPRAGPRRRDVVRREPHHVARADRRARWGRDGMVPIAADDGARLLGAHLEGPFLSPAKAGNPSGASTCATPDVAAAGVGCRRGSGGRRDDRP